MDLISVTLSMLVQKGTGLSISETNTWDFQNGAKQKNTQYVTYNSADKNASHKKEENDQISSS